MTAARRNTHSTDSPEHARALLAEAKTPVLVLGFGAVIANAGADALALAARLPNLRVVSTPRAKGVFPEDHPQYRGVIGFAGHSEARRCLFEDADLVLIVGTRLGELTSDNWDPRWQQLRSIRIDIMSQSANWLCRSECALVGDASAVLSQLVAGAPAKSGTRFVPPEHANEPPRYEPEPVSRHATLPLTTLHPAHVMRVINERYPQPGHVFCGIGNTMAWGIHYLKRTCGNRWHVNLGSGAMGHAVPAAIGAALGGGRALAILGDAEFLMTGFELHTATELELNVVVIVLNDEGHGMVRVGAKAHCGGKAPSADFTRPVHLVRASRAMGAFALRARTLPQLVSALRAALRRRGPTVIEVPIERDLVPPLGERLRALSHSFGETAKGKAS